MTDFKYLLEYVICKLNAGLENLIYKNLITKIL